MIEIAKNIKSEAEAIEQYMPMLKNSETEILAREIVGDEINHLLLLLAKLVKGMDLSISEDNMEEALKIINDHVK